MSRYTLLSFVRDMDRASRSVAYNRRVVENRQKRAYEKMRSLEERERKAATREEKARYVAQRIEAVEELNEAIAAAINNLKGVLRQTLSIDDTINFNSLLTKDDFPSFSPPKEIAKPLKAPERHISDLHIRPLNFIEKWFKSRRVERQERFQALRQVEYDELYKTEIADYQKAEKERVGMLSDLEASYKEAREAFQKEASKKNEEVERFKSLYRQGETQAIEAYISLVLDRSIYDDDFPAEHVVSFSVKSRTLQVKKLLPPASVVPSVAEHKYVKSSDTVTEKPRSKTDVKGIYSAIICQIALRTIHEVIEADQGNWVNAVEFIGYLNAINPIKGGEWTPCVAALTVSAKDFKEIKLNQIDPQMCFAGLSGRIAKVLDGTVAIEKTLGD